MISSRFIAAFVPAPTLDRRAMSAPRPGTSKELRISLGFMAGKIEVLFALTVPSTNTSEFHGVHGVFGASSSDLWQKRLLMLQCARSAHFPLTIAHHSRSGIVLAILSMLAHPPLSLSVTPLLADCTHRPLRSLLIALMTRCAHLSLRYLLTALSARCAHDSLSILLDPLARLSLAEHLLAPLALHAVSSLRSLPAH